MALLTTDALAVRVKQKPLEKLRASEHPVEPWQLVVANGHVLDRHDIASPVSPNAQRNVHIGTREHQRLVQAAKGVGSETAAAVHRGPAG